MDAVLKDHPTQCPSLPKPRSFWQRIADRLAALLGMALIIAGVLVIQLFSGSSGH